MFTTLKLKLATRDGRIYLALFGLLCLFISYQFYQGYQSLALDRSGRLIEPLSAAKNTESIYSLQFNLEKYNDVLYEIQQEQSWWNHTVTSYELWRTKERIAEAKNWDGTVEAFWKENGDLYDGTYNALIFVAIAFFVLGLVSLIFAIGNFFKPPYIPKDGEIVLYR